MIVVLMDNYPYEKKYIALPLCEKQMNAVLYYGTLKSDVKYVGTRDGKGRLSEILRGLHLAGSDLQELNLLAYTLTRLDGTSQRREPAEKKQKLKQCLAKGKYSLRELINKAYAVDDPVHPRRYTGDNLQQLLLLERDAYGPRLDMEQPKPEPQRKIGEMVEGKLYWMTGISQFSDYQAFFRQGDSLVQCSAWYNSDGSIRFSEGGNEPIVYTRVDLPSPELTLEDADDMLSKLYYAYMEDEVPDGIRYEYVGSCLLPEDFAQESCATHQMGGIQ